MNTHQAATDAQKEAETVAMRRIDEMPAEFPGMTEQERSQWTRNAYVAQSGSAAYLRQLLKEVREFAIKVALSCPELKLTVEQARLLDCCRICYGESKSAFTMDYGKEYAHTLCLGRCPHCNRELTT